jgi:hypothetical protein
MATLTQPEVEEYISAVQLFVFPALLVIAHNTGSMFLHDSDFEYDSKGEVTGVTIPPDLHDLALVVAQDMYRYAQN